ncbi:hypothetical protein [Oryza sativa Japonica Group]|uniref:Uncharacterized protein n=2 Tax=Oryza sativa subsp. japonica TaxID=39947 RepID=Q5ZCX9_ORYSJ|nr:hypothetical protein [Oryza sativa Japonica Group]BAD61374.1 hypothetical protein [Oryza sativa Japonica Group]
MPHWARPPVWPAIGSHMYSLELKAVAVEEDLVVRATSSLAAWPDGADQADDAPPLTASGTIAPSSPLRFPRSAPLLLSPLRRGSKQMTTFSDRELLQEWEVLVTNYGHAKPVKERSPLPSLLHASNLSM